MATAVQVETFECSETAAEPIEASEEAIALINELGLAGQQELVAKPEGKPESRCPYREITAEERMVYRTLCPEKCNLDQYKASPVPLRVLQLAAHANSLGLFQRMEVWDCESVLVPDPVLVAHTGKYDWSDNTTFILARWGAELETFAVLLKKAVEIRRQVMLDQLKAVQEEVVAKIALVKGVTPAAIVKAGAERSFRLEGPLDR